MNNFLKKLKPTNDNWVSKILNKRKNFPVYMTLIIITGILVNNFYISYSETMILEESNNKIKNRIKENNDKSKQLDILINNSKNKINEMKEIKLDPKKPVSFISKVCELLKKREVIGSYYIIKKDNDKYANVLNIEIQASYGDIDLLYLVTKIVMEKVFYLKSIEQTENGVKCELYKPLK